MSIDIANPGTSNTSNRRTFLLAGSALVAGATLLRREAPVINGGLSALVSSHGPRIGVGYVEGSAEAVSLEAVLASGHPRVVPAATLTSGDLNNRAAALLVHGFSPGISCDGSCKYNNVFVDAHLPSPDVSDAQPTLPFYAWTFRRSPAMASGRSRFVVGASRGLRVGFSIATSSSPTSKPTTATTVFTTGRLNLNGLPQLQRGIYLLGMNEGAWSTSASLPDIDDPKWSELASIVVSVEGV
jgi:hypothetical protein